MYFQVYCCLPFLSIQCSSVVTIKRDQNTSVLVRMLVIHTMDTAIGIFYNYSTMRSKSNDFRIESINKICGPEYIQAKSERERNYNTMLLCTYAIKITKLEHNNYVVIFVAINRTWNGFIFIMIYIYRGNIVVRILIGVCFFLSSWISHPNCFYQLCRHDI